ncbi:MAG TPA: hypothetical protein PK609_03840 [Candidatus Paceibacterota bacterium]|nr:hypothetical protein [Candidatus Paceibacterota bacterium]
MRTFVSVVGDAVAQQCLMILGELKAPIEIVERYEDAPAGSTVIMSCAHDVRIPSRFLRILPEGAEARAKEALDLGIELPEPLLHTAGVAVVVRSASSLGTCPYDRLPGLTKALRNLAGIKEEKKKRARGRRTDRLNAMGHFVNC